MLTNIKAYMKPKPVFKSILLNQKSYVVCEPLGVVLIISPWNYPIVLTLGPLIGAIGAGNCVIIKPSELSPCTARAFAELIPKYLDNVGRTCKCNTSIPVVMIVGMFPYY